MCVPSINNIQMMQFILWRRNQEFEILVYILYKNGISHVYHCQSAQSTWVSSEQYLLTESITCFMHACLVSNSSSSGTCSPWSPASLSCGGGVSAVARPVFRKPAKISTGYAKYMTNKKRYTTVMPRIYYYQFGIPGIYHTWYIPCKLYLVYTIPI